MLSIIIPAYNEGDYIGGLLSCLKRQTFHDFEVIVADANSTDKTAKIVKSLAARVARVVLGSLIGG